MSKIHVPGDEYELLPTGCEDHVTFRQYRGGRCIAGGVANRGSGAMAPGSEVLDLTPPDAEGRRQCKGHFTINAQGSVCHSRASTPEYRDGLAFSSSCEVKYQLGLALRLEFGSADEGKALELLSQSTTNLLARLLQYLESDRTSGSGSESEVRGPKSEVQSS